MDTLQIWHAICFLTGLGAGVEFAADHPSECFAQKGEFVRPGISSRAVTLRSSFTLPKMFVPQASVPPPRGEDRGSIIPKGFFGFMQRYRNSCAVEKGKTSMFSPKKFTILAISLAIFFLRGVLGLRRRRNGLEPTHASRHNGCWHFAAGKPRALQPSFKLPFSMRSTASTGNTRRCMLPRPHPPGASRRAAAVQRRLHTTLVALFLPQKATFDARLAVSLTAIAADPHETSAGIAAGIAWGTTVANGILACAIHRTDSRQRHLHLLAERALGQWRPTPPAFAPGAGPQFATSVPWVISTPSQYRPGGPPALTSARYRHKRFQ